MSVALSGDEADVHASHSYAERGEDGRSRWHLEGFKHIQTHAHLISPPPKNLEEVLTFAEKGHKEAEMPSLLGEGEKVYAWRDCWP